MENKTGPIITLGDGKYAISPAYQKETDTKIVVFEKGLGAGTVGAEVPGRKTGTEISPEEMEKADLIIEFKNIECLDVLINVLRDTRKLFNKEKP